MQEKWWSLGVSALSFHIILFDCVRKPMISDKHQVQNTNVTLFSKYIDRRVDVQYDFLLLYLTGSRE